jgi:hypothetical protein
MVLAPNSSSTNIDTVRLVSGHVCLGPVKICGYVASGGEDRRRNMYVATAPEDP